MGINTDYRISYYSKLHTKNNFCTRQKGVKCIKKRLPNPPLAWNRTQHPSSLASRSCWDPCASSSGWSWTSRAPVRAGCTATSRPQLLNRRGGSRTRRCHGESRRTLAWGRWRSPESLAASRSSWPVRAPCRLRMRTDRVERSMLLCCYPAGSRPDWRHPALRR